MKEEDLTFHGANVRAMLASQPLTLGFMAYSHCTRTGRGQAKGMGPILMDPNLLWRIVHTRPDREGNQDLLFPIMPVQLPVPAPVPFPCSVNKPLVSFI